MKKIAVLLLIALVFLGGCLQKKVAEKEPENELVNHTDFKLFKPVNWSETEVVNASLPTFIYSPKNTSSEAVTITITPLKRDDSLEKVMDKDLEIVKKDMPDFTIKEGPMTTEMGSFNGTGMKFTGTVGNNSIEFDQFITKKYNKVYTITYVCIKGSCNYYDMFDAMVSNIEFLNSTNASK